MKKTLLILLSLPAFFFSANGQAPAWWPENGQTLSNLNNINFADNSTGWFFGDSVIGPNFQKGIIKKTTNQGLNWTAQNMGSNAIQILSSYVFSTTAVVAVGKFQTTGKGAMIKTTNGGNNWTKDTTSFAERLFDVDFANTSMGWVVGRNGYLAFTSNGGTTWTVQTTGAGSHLFSVDFIDQNHGWAVGADPGTGGTIIHTNNGGATWTSQNNTAPGDLFSIQAFSPARAIAVGAGGIIVVTSDSGNTWATRNSGTNQDLLDLSFVNAADGWAAGIGGTMIITTDSGNTWTPQISGTVNNINSIHMNNTGLGWYCGDAGSVYFYGPSPAGMKNQTVISNELDVFPNPSMGLLTVTVNNANASELQIYNALGKNAGNWQLSAGPNSIDLSNQPKGIYFCRLTSAGKIISTCKIILN